MLSDEIIAAELEVCRQQREQIPISKSKLREWEGALSHQEKALYALRQSRQKLAEKQEELKPALRGCNCRCCARPPTGGGSPA